MSACAILETRGLCHSYRAGSPILDNVSIALGKGARTAILGANGAGKSTLLLALSGGLQAEDGEVRLEGKALTHSAAGLRAWRTAVQLVVQDPDDQLFAPTVAADVSFGPINLGCSRAEAAARAEAAMLDLGIADLGARPVHELSHGQKQRAAIAGALAMRPRVLLLDEPTSGLDDTGVRRLLASLEAQRQAGTTVALSTHDESLACRWADEVIILHHGRVIAQGPPSEALLAPAVRDAGAVAVPGALAVGLALRERGFLAPHGPLPTSIEAAVRLIRNASGTIKS